MQGQGRVRSDFNLTGRAFRLALVPLLLIGLSGCGYLFVDGPPSDWRQANYVQCTESDVGPILDAVWAGLNLAGTVVIAADPDAYEDEWDISSGAGIASGVFWTALSGSSSIVGFNKVSDCRNAKRTIAERQAESQGSRQEGSLESYEQDLYEALERNR